MQRPDLTFKIETLGNLVLELNHWDAVLLHNSDIIVAEQEFDKVLDAIKEMKQIILEELDGYFQDCKLNNEPVFLPYWTIRKELRESNF
jgi:hypothetical protein